MLDEEFVGCCRGRPKYTSEPCVDALLENNTLSSECVINCIYREFEIYDGETINMASVKTFLETQVTQEEEFVTMYTNAFEMCSKLDKDTIAKKFHFFKFVNEHGCDEFPPLIDMCVWYHTLANCPESYASDSETCINKKQWVTSAFSNLKHLEFKIFL
ncbi:hypothetical protein DOY81_010654 [Sarcophaga bullata]|nr:hypothetical protein DOY81_010654 [Sarcophaga bullata]